MSRPAIGAGMLDGEPDQRFDQRAEHDFAGDGLRRLDDGGDVQLPNRGVDRRRRRERRRLDAKMRVQCVELPDLAVRSPAEIAGPAALQIGVRDRRRSRAPRRSAPRSRGRALRRGRSRAHAPTGWPLRTAARRRARGRRAARSRQRPAPCGRRSSRGSAAPTPRAADECASQGLEVRRPHRRRKPIARRRSCERGVEMVLGDLEERRP